jgi:hypothetical protein
LDTRSLLLTAKKVLSASVATALARYDLPVPGGPYSRKPLHALRLPAVARGGEGCSVSGVYADEKADGGALPGGRDVRVCACSALRAWASCGARARARALG